MKNHFLGFCPSLCLFFARRQKERACLLHPCSQLGPSKAFVENMGAERYAQHMCVLKHTRRKTCSFHNEVWTFQLNEQVRVVTRSLMYVCLSDSTKSIKFSIHPHRKTQILYHNNFPIAIVICQWAKSKMRILCGTNLIPLSHSNSKLELQIQWTMILNQEKPIRHEL
jgi:hypothetical protein